MATNNPKTVHKKEMKEKVGEEVNHNEKGTVEGRGENNVPLGRNKRVIRRVTRRISLLQERETRPIHSNKKVMIITINTLSNVYTCALSHTFVSSPPSPPPPLS